jgi:sugar phosphate isomerase/epimerase
MVFTKDSPKGRSAASIAHRHSLGMFSWFGYDIPMKDRLRVIRQAGFDATSVWWGPFDNIGADYHDVPAMVRDAGLRMDNAHLPYDYPNLLWCDSDLIRDAVVAQHIRWLDECVAHGFDTVVMHITTGSQARDPAGEGIDAIRRIVEAAEQRNLVVAIENVRSRRHLDLVFAEIESDHLAFCYDSSHDRLWNPDRAWLLRWLGNRLAVTHLSDNDGQEDRHWLPGEGVIDWNKLATVFPHESYRGCIHLEVLPGGGSASLSPEAFVAKAHEKAVWLEKTLFTSRQA